MDWEQIQILLAGFVFYGILYSLPYCLLKILLQRSVYKLCKYRGTKEKPGAGCVTCAYHHQCDRAKQSKEYKWYSYCRRVLPDKAKEIFDEIWDEEKARAERPQ